MSFRRQLGKGEASRLPPPHHRTNGSRIRRFGSLSQHAAIPVSEPQPDRLLPPRQQGFIPATGVLPHGLAGCHVDVPWPATAPLFHSPRGELFGPLGSDVAAWPTVALPFGLECFASLACLAPTLPFGDFSTVFSAGCPRPASLPGRPPAKRSVPSHGFLVRLDHTKTKAARFSTSSVPTDTGDGHLRFHNTSTIVLNSGEELIQVRDWHCDLS